GSDDNGDDGGLDLSLGSDDNEDDGDLDLSLDSDDTGGDGGLDLSLDSDDTGDDGGLNLSLDMESENTQGPGDSLDLDGLDIPDLSTSGGELGALDETLPDLEMDGLDIEASVSSPSTPVPPPSGAGKDNVPSPGAKTGTALDDFDIDLGDLG
ncbi:MAG: hypothetical protein D3910_04795, partial [Candidatus Electrothrix sp. ATG2]|nr:hypothetical protein [Candidatus Electrothrix sp. ATG2]